MRALYGAENPPVNLQDDMPWIYSAQSVHWVIRLDDSVIIRAQNRLAGVMKRLSTVSGELFTKIDSELKECEKPVMPLGLPSWGQIQLCLSLAEELRQLRDFLRQQELADYRELKRAEVTT